MVKTRMKTTTCPRNRWLFRCKTLQEQAQKRHKQLQQLQLQQISSDDQAAIEALQKEASGAAATGDDNPSGSGKLVIDGFSNTFQRGGDNNNTMESKEEFQNDIEKLPEDVPVQSQVYKAVPISEFGAAMLRGMGWTGDDENKSKKGVSAADPTTMPRPSRLGLGATPKMLLAEGEDAPDTHGRRRRPRRHDQVQREERMKRQQEEYQQERAKQIAMDKQQTLQEGSIVNVVVGDSDNNNVRPPRRRRARIEKLAGVPGLNMILVLFEKESEPTKVKKGSVTLIERQELIEQPFEEGVADKPAVKQESNGSREEKQPRAKEERSRDDRKRDKSREGDDDDRKRKERSSDRKESLPKKSRKEHSSSSNRDSTPTWMIPNICVRIVSRKYGDRHYKEKGVVVDITRKGMATLNMNNGQVLQVAERHLETALPKVGGNTCILAGKHRLAKGRLVERDSKANRGAVQIFEDMSIVTTSLDDMAEWCGPLDDDLDHPHY